MELALSTALAAGLAFAAAAILVFRRGSGPDAGARQPVAAAWAPAAWAPAPSPAFHPTPLPVGMPLPMPMPAPPRPRTETVAERPTALAARSARPTAPGATPMPGASPASGASLTRVPAFTPLPPAPPTSPSPSSPRLKVPAAYAETMSSPPIPLLPSLELLAETVSARPSNRRATTDLLTDVSDPPKAMRCRGATERDARDLEDLTARIDLRGTEDEVTACFARRPAHRVHPRLIARA